MDTVETEHDDEEKEGEIKDRYRITTKSVNRWKNRTVPVYLDKELEDRYVEVIREVSQLISTREEIGTIRFDGSRA